MRSDWYRLFSRGAADWLRHNDKVRDAVRRHLPDALAGPDLITGAGPHRVEVPVRLLQHARFRLSDEYARHGAGQGAGRPGDILRAPSLDDDDTSAGNIDGPAALLMEFAVDEIMDWLWEDLALPRLKPRGNATLDQPGVERAGWDKHGVRARLDRRCTVKQAIKRRLVQPAQAAFTNDDLRFRQLVTRPQPGCSAVVLFLLDASGSMTSVERRLAKTFFFLALHGLRRKYRHIETRFLAHAAQAWQFAEADFFEVSGAGGTMASSGFGLALDLLHQHYDTAGWNSYLFYASDGDNFSEDRDSASVLLAELARQANYLGYVETLPGMPRIQLTEMCRLWQQQEQQGSPMSTVILSDTDDVFMAIRQFLGREAQA